MTRHRLIPLLAHLDLFADLGPQLLEELAREAREVQLGIGEVLFRQGERDSSLYVLAHGRLAAVRGLGTDRKAILGEIAPGETIGEMSLLTEEPRSATVVAIRDSELLHLSGTLIHRLFERCPAFLLRLSRLLVHRLQKSMEPPAQDARIRTVALVHARTGPDRVAVDEHFARAFRRIGPTHLSGSEEPLAAARGDRAHRLAWLHDREREVRYVLLSVGVTGTEWDSFCIGQADRVLLLASGDELAGLDLSAAPIWRDITASPYRQVDLAVLSPSGATRPEGTEGFLVRHGLDLHYHLRLGCAADFERAARCITGHAHGLVLGGGGARGFAHVGVVQALAEHGIPVDHVAGTSMGAFIAAEFAMGMEHLEMNRLNREVFIDSNPTSDYTVPLVSMLAGQKCNRNLAQVFGDLAIGDLWLPYFCVSASLTRAEAHIHRSGRLWEAVRASISIPGVFPPVVMDDQVLVDGGIVNNLPVALARQRYPGRIIAVEVSGSSRMRPPDSGSGAFSPWALIGDRLRPKRDNTPKVPSILEILVATGTFGKEQSLFAGLSSADLFIQPALERFQTLNWTPMDTIAEVGYREACRVLAGVDLQAWEG